MATATQTSSAPTMSKAGRPGPSPPPETALDQQLSRWGGVAGLGGALLLLGSIAVVVGLGLPDASDVETLTDFRNIESGRIAEHFLYLGALMGFALHVFVLERLLRAAHPAAALFGTVVSSFGLVMMAASSLLHLSTSPLADLYTASNTPPEDLRSIEYAWHGTQSVFDTMLVTGALLVPIGLAIFGLAMSKAPAFGARMAMLAIGLGLVGTVGAVIGIVDPGSMFVAASVLTIALFHLIAGWRTLRLGRFG